MRGTSAGSWMGFSWLRPRLALGVILLLVLPCFSRAQAQNGTLAINLESGQVLAPFIVSNGCLFQAVKTSLAQGGRASWKFTVTVRGDYALVALVETPVGANSFLVNIDAEPQEPAMVWDIPAASGPQTRIASWRGEGMPEKNEFTPKYFRLEPGEHEIILRGCEAGVKLQSLTVAKRPGPVVGLRATN